MSMKRDGWSPSEKSLSRDQKSGLCSLYWDMIGSQTSWLATCGSCLNSHLSFISPQWFSPSTILPNGVAGPL